MGLTELKPVTLRAGACVNLDPRETVTLRGVVSGPVDDSTIKIYPRQVPDVNIIAEVKDNRKVSLTIANNSDTKISISDNVVLGEIEKTDTNGSPLCGSIRALVGPVCETHIQINNKQYKGLIDSGSQVTIIPLNVAQELNLDIHDLSENLTVYGAGNQTVSYLGYTIIQLRCPEQVVGTREIIDVHALVCPSSEPQLPIVIGTNAICKLAKKCEENHGSYFLTKLPIKNEIRFMYHRTELDDSKTGKLGHMRLNQKRLVVSPGETAEIKVSCRMAIADSVSAVLIQESENCPETQVAACRARTRELNHMKISIRNTSEEDLVLKRNQIVADIFLIEAEYDVHDFVSKLQEEVTEFPEENPTVFSGPGVASMVNQGKSLDFKFGENTPESWRKEFGKKLMQYEDVFIQHDYDVGEGAKTEPVDIKLEPGPHIFHRPRPLPPSELEEVRQHIQNLLDANIIEPSCSDYSSPIVIVRKKSGKIRMVIDYRKINNQILKDNYSIPKIEDLFTTLSGSKFYTSMDLSNAYYQIPLAKEAQRVSAFTTPVGNYQWLRMPMGLKNSGSQFQRIIEHVFADMNLLELIVFLDDILVHGKTLEDLETRTLNALSPLRKYKLKLDPAKCIFGASEVKHLGFIITGDCIKPDPEKLSALKNYPVPKTVKEVKSFLGFCGFYRRMVPNFAQIARPLYKVTEGYVPAKMKKNRVKKDKEVLNLSSDITHLWEKPQQEAFEKLILALTSEPVIGIADKTLPFEIRCDSSGFGLGAVLVQQQGENCKVISYASRSLNKTEANYPAHKREFLALKWALDKFHDYVIGCKIVVYTDNNPLCYVLKSAKLDATSHRWLAGLSVYDLEIRFKKGSANVDADILSRIPSKNVEEDVEYLKQKEKIEFLLERTKPEETLTIRSNAVQAIMGAHGIREMDINVARRSEMESIRPLGDIGMPAVDQIAFNPSKIPEDILEPRNAKTEYQPTKYNWYKLQREDYVTSDVIKSVARGEKVKIDENSQNVAELKVFAREFDKLILKEGVLYRKTVDPHDEVIHQLVIPRAARKEALIGVHEDLYHTHFDEGIAQARLRYFWPFMATDLKKKIEGCMRCKQSRARPQKAEMQTIVTTTPNELICIDYLTIEEKGKKVNILVIMDHFTKFSQAVVTPDQTARNVARALWENYFSIYGFPSRILSDRGRDFESNLIRELCNVAQIKKCRTTPYHPSGNPVERWNRTLIGMLRTLEDEQKQNWRKHLRSVVHAYNSCIHSSTGYSPYHLFFGRMPRLPIDLVFGIEVGKVNKVKGTRQYVQNLKQSLQNAYRFAADQMKHKAEQNKVRYDKSAYANELYPNDRVLVKRVGPKIYSKVSDKWEKDVYLVLSKNEGVPVYVVKPENSEGPIRTLHRNMLLPIGSFGFEAFDNPKVSQEKNKIEKEPSTKSFADKQKQKTNTTPEKVVNQGEKEQNDFDENENVEFEITVGFPEGRDEQALTLRPDAPIFVPQENRKSISNKEIQDRKDGQVPAVAEEQAGFEEEETPKDSEESNISEEVEEEFESLVEENEKTPPKPLPRRSSRAPKPIQKLSLGCRYESSQAPNNLIDLVYEYVKNIFYEGTVRNHEKFFALCSEMYQNILRNLHTLAQ